MAIMKFQVILLALIFITPNVICHRKDISGTYYCKTSGRQIIITENNLFYIEPHYGLAIWANDTLAKCHYKWVDADYIEINSVVTTDYAREGLTVNQVYNHALNDSIKIVFSFPCYIYDLIINIHTDTFNTISFTYSKKNNSITIPLITKNFSFDISPQCIKPHTADGLFYGSVVFEPFQKYRIEENMNLIEINIPALSDTYFEQYYIKSDYIKVYSNKVIWKGETFRKISVE